VKFCELVAAPWQLSAIGRTVEETICAEHV
jgi:hypothetical protein